MLERILGIILPVFLIVALGYVYAWRIKPDMTMVNRISMNVLAPALIFSALAGKDFDVTQSKLLMLGSVAVVLGSGLLAWPVAKLLKADVLVLLRTVELPAAARAAPGGARPKPPKELDVVVCETAQGLRLAPIG